MPQLSVRAEKARPPATAAETSCRAGWIRPSPRPARTRAAGGQADLAFHAPRGARGLLGAVEVVARGGPGAGAPGEGGGVDAVLGERLAGTVGACSGGADDQDAAAVGGVADGGEGA